ncbi:MAG: response regulator [Sandaracinaceae bacterium]|nr:response regulator [Sandaracinaceae bacterium]
MFDDLRDDSGVCLIAPDGTVLHRDEAFGRVLGVDVRVGVPLARSVPWLAGLDVSAPQRVDARGVRVELEPTPALREVAAVVRAQRPSREAELARELRIARGTLSSLLDAAPVSVLVLDLDQRVTVWNAAATRTFGWRADEVVGGPYRIVPDDAAAAFGELFARVVGGEGFTGVEAPRVRKDGSLVHTRIHTAPMRDADGRVVGAMAILEDLTEQRRLEGQLRQGERLEAVGRLAGGIAHDFNNLLTVILGICEVLERAPVAPERLAEGLTQIRECGVRAQSLTAQLLAFSRRQIMHLEIADMSALVRGTAGMLQRLIDERVEMALELDDEPLPIHVDPSQFDQVLVNLVVNARDAMRDGGRVVVRTSRVDTPDRGPEARLEVADDGPGIAPDVLPHIFDPFFTTKGPGQGTGLGLATVHGIVEQSGGWIRVESAEGHGATFEVGLPLAHEAPSARPAPSATDHPRGQERVLLVEDDPQVRLITTRPLDTLGYDVLAVADGREALDRLDGGLEVDVVMTDLAMPRMGGRELARRLRARGHASPILYVSANLDDDAVRAELDAGHAHFLQKPFTLSALALALRGCLD